MPGIISRKIHKKENHPPRNFGGAIVKCGVKYPGVVTADWSGVTCPKCLNLKGANHDYQKTD